MPGGSPSAEEAPRSLTYGGGMVSAWIFVVLATLAALACGVGAWRLARRPKGSRR